jgi:hypothetical protein
MVTRLPAYRVNPMLDLSPISNALTGYQQQMNTNDQLGMQDRQLVMREKEFDDNQRQRTADRMSRYADMYFNESDPTKKAAIGQGMLKLHPQIVPKLQEAGIDHTNPDIVARFFKAEGSNYDPLGEKAKLAQIDASRASTANAGAAARRAQMEFETQRTQYANMTPDQRRQAAPTLGLNPGTPEYTKFVISGAAPDSANSNAAQQITWGRDANGNWVAMQATRGGELVQSKLPGGVTPVPVPEMAEAKSAATKRGEAFGQAQVDLPGVEMRAGSMKDALDAVEAGIRQNPRMTGWTGNLPNVTPGARDVQAKVDQVQGKVFLQAFDALRGAGAITEQEGAQAKAALSRLQTTQVGTADYLAAIADVRKEIDLLVGLARRKANPQTSGTPTARTQAQPSAAPRQRAVNPQTGQAVEFDGTAWVPVR